jgi:hypothetical protein
MTYVPPRKKLIHDSRSLERNVNPGPPKYGTGMLTTRPRRSMQHYTKAVKQSHNTLKGAQGERMYRCYSCTTSALDGGELLASRPGRALAPGKGPPVPIGQEAGWAPESFWTQRLEEKSSCLCRRSNLYRPVVESVVRHYTD